MKDRKNVIVVAVFVVAGALSLFYFLSLGGSRPTNPVSAIPSNLTPGNIVVVSKPVFGCPSLTAMDALHNDSVAHDEIGFRNHFDSNHCQDLPIGPDGFRILKFSTGEAGSQYVRIRGLKNGAELWAPFDSGAFSKKADH
ncbi:MAG: hypothetical protein ACYDAM_09960 [Leptospirales bacterium]